MTNLIKTSLSSGIWGGSLDGRVDLERQDASLKLLNNFFATRYGGVTTRPGFEWKHSFAGLEHWLIPFNFGVQDNQNYVLAMGNSKMRVFSQGTQNVLRSRVLPAVTGAPQWVTSTANSNWRYLLGDSTVDSDKRLQENPDGIRKVEVGGAITEYTDYGTPGTLPTDYAGTQTNWIWGDYDTLGYSTVYVNFYSDGFVLDMDAVYTSPYSLDIIKQADHTQSFDIMYFTHQTLGNEKLQRTAESYSSGSYDPWVNVYWEFQSYANAPSIAPPPDLAALVNGHATPNRTIKYAISAISPDGDESFIPGYKEVQVTYPWPTSDNVQLFWDATGTTATGDWTASGVNDEYYKVVANSVGQTIDALFQDRNTTSLYNEPLALTYIAGGVGTLGFGQWTYEDSPAGFPDTRVYTIRIDDPNSPGTADAPDGVLPGGLITARWNDTASYNVWRNERGVWQWLNNTQAPYMMDDNIIGDSSYTPRTAGKIFKTPDDYARGIAIFQQRLCQCGTNNNPQTLWASTLGNLQDYSIRTPLTDDDAINVTLDSQSLEVAHYLVPHRKLLMFTDRTIQVFDHGNNSDSLTPLDPQFRIQEYVGCSSTVKPIATDNEVLFVGRDNKRLYTARYDGRFDGYEVKELSIYCPELFVSANSGTDLPTRSIIQIAFSREPHDLIWMLLDDGTLLTSTYIPSQEMNAWATHTTADKRTLPGSPEQFKSLCVVNEDGYDKVYVCVERGIDFTLERLYTTYGIEGTEPFFVDSGVAYYNEGPTITGLDHLEFRTDVVALVDGVVEGPFTVSSGSITVSGAFTNAYVGLPYDKYWQTNILEWNDRSGTVQGRRKNISDVTVRQRNTYGGSCGRVPEYGYDANLILPILDSGSVVNGDITDNDSDDINHRIDVLWDTKGLIRYEQSDPLPSTILALMMELEVERNSP